MSLRAPAGGWRTIIPSLGASGSPTRPRQRSSPRLLSDLVHIEKAMTTTTLGKRRGRRCFDARAAAQATLSRIVLGGDNRSEPASKDGLIHGVISHADSPGARHYARVFARCEGAAAILHD